MLIILFFNTINMNKRRITVVRPSQMFDSFMDEFFSAPRWDRNGTFGDIEVNVKDSGENILVDAKMPGFEKSEINIHVEDNILVIEGSKSIEKEEGDKDSEYYLREYSTENVRRSVSLPSKVDGDSAEAEMKNGILKIKIPKQAEVMPKKISIKD